MPEGNVRARELLDREVHRPVSARDDDGVGAELDRGAQKPAGFGGAASADDRRAHALFAQSLGRACARHRCARRRARRD